MKQQEIEELKEEDVIYNSPDFWEVAYITNCYVRLHKCSNFGHIRTPISGVIGDSDMSKDRMVKKTSLLYGFHTRFNINSCHNPSDHLSTAKYKIGDQYDRFRHEPEPAPQPEPESDEESEDEEFNAWESWNEYMGTSEYHENSSKENKRIKKKLLGIHYYKRVTSL